MSRKSILFLRPFVSDRDATLMVIIAGAAVKNFGRMTVIGPPARNADLRGMWHSTGIADKFDDVFDTIESDALNWKGRVVTAIERADVVVLHISANDDGFSNWEIPADGIAYDPADLYKVPLSRLTTGAGLLCEIGFLSRMKAMSRTVLLCDIDELEVVENRVKVAGFAAASGHIHTGSGRSLIPRLTALDKQLADVANVSCVVPFGRPELNAGDSIGNIIGRLRTAVMSVMQALTVTARTPDPAGHIPLGTSDRPREMAPDGKRKIIDSTPPEELNGSLSQQVSCVRFPERRCDVCFQWLRSNVVAPTAMRQLKTCSSMYNNSPGAALMRFGGSVSDAGDVPLCGMMC